MTKPVARWVAQFSSGRILDIGCAGPLDRARASERRELHRSRLSCYRKTFVRCQARCICRCEPAAASGSVGRYGCDALEVLEHLCKHQEALGEIARVLRPNGRLLLTVPFLYPVHDAPHDYQRLTAYGLIRDLEAVGLRVEAISPALHSAETAGLIANLAVGGMAMLAIQTRSSIAVLLCSDPGHRYSRDQFARMAGWATTTLFGMQLPLAICLCGNEQLRLHSCRLVFGSALGNQSKSLRVSPNEQRLSARNIRDRAPTHQHERVAV